MTYDPTEAQVEDIKNGDFQLRVALDRHLNDAERFQGFEDKHGTAHAVLIRKGWTFLTPIPFAPGDTFPVTDDMTATVTAVRVERLQGDWVAVATIETKGT